MEVEPLGLILKLLKRLQDLNITVDILVETGIGKTVNGFRKNKDVGEIAKELVFQWKKLIPQQPSSKVQNEKKGESDHGTKTARVRNASKSSRLSTNSETLHVNKCARLLNEEGPEKEDGITCSQPHSLDNLDQLKTSKPKSSQKGGRGYCCLPKSNSPPDQAFFKCEKSTSSIKNRSNFSRKDEQLTGDAESTEDQDKRGLSLEASATPCKGSEERSYSGKSSHKNYEKKNKSMNKTKHSTLPSKVETSSEKKEGCNKPQEKSCESEETMKNCKMQDSSDSVNEEFGKPVMTFESYLNYEEPKRRAQRCRKRKTLPTMDMGGCSKLLSREDNNGCRIPCGKESKSKGNAAKRNPCDEDIWTSKANKKLKVDINALLDIPLPKFLPDVTDVPFDFPSASPIKKSVTPNVLDKVEFTGRRLNCKMQVYSGCKTTNILKMMSLYEQCIRVLQNNIDSIHEVGGVPFEIIEPVLDRCTSEQLCRIEDCNPSFMEQTNHLWMKHCKKDFKTEQPQEYESWRELYLRLYNERERKLKILTQSISSAHANKPKGRRVKLAFVNTSAKPPRGVLRQQGKAGSAGAAHHNSSKQRIKYFGSAECPSGGSGSFDGSQSSSSKSTASGPSGPDTKRQIKKIAPMMAKSLRAFKNRLGPR
ncbi:elongin A, like isoform X1 [Narcine bancroftii]|uniref:elongin A, like isoform X1 n=1 Tax=Narcine bancroftii TaxID=1343680 RepID=UPI003832118E